MGLIDVSISSVTETYTVEAADIDRLREAMRKSEAHAVLALKAALEDAHPLARLKFVRLGCDPLNTDDAQNLAEQIDQQATYEAAVDALEILTKNHPGKRWVFEPGARGSGHDIYSLDGEVAAEVFAAVTPRNNGKLMKDIAKVSAFVGKMRYVFFRSPGFPFRQRSEGAVEIISLGGA